MNKLIKFWIELYYKFSLPIWVKYIVKHSESVRSSEIDIYGAPSESPYREIATIRNFTFKTYPVLVLVDNKPVMEWHKGYQRLNYGEWVLDVRDIFLAMHDEVKRLGKIEKAERYERIDND